MWIVEEIGNSATAAKKGNRVFGLVYVIENGELGEA